jgi:superfamily II helicase
MKMMLEKLTRFGLEYQLCETKKLIGYVEKAILDPNFPLTINDMKRVQKNLEIFTDEMQKELEYRITIEKTQNFSSDTTGSTADFNLTKNIIKSYAVLQKKSEDGGLLCPRCGKDNMKSALYTNAQSRETDIHICDSCGTDEALRALRNEALPLSEWSLVVETLRSYNAGEG